MLSDITSFGKIVIDMEAHRFCMSVTLIPFTERNDLLTCSLEIICVEIIRPCSKSFLVSTWYRPPNSDAQVFDDFEVFLRNYDSQNKKNRYLQAI